MRSFVKNVAAYSASHFLVDFACAYIVFSTLYGSPDWLLYLLIYNFCAFALQMPIGVLADRIGCNRIFAAIGALLVASAFLFNRFPIPLAAVAGLGNAFFHIGGGRDVLCGSHGRFTALGIFVSPGAIGLFLGTLCGKSAALSWQLPFFVLIVTAAYIYLALEDHHLPSKADKPLPILPVYVAIALTCLFVVVFIRSYSGMVMVFPWKTSLGWKLAAVFSLAFGKAAGGILADRFGAVKVTLLSLALCAVFSVFYEEPHVGIAAILLFNMTMPISLGAVVRLMPRSPGFGFGLLTFALFIGILPVIFDIWTCSWFMPLGFTLACVISAALMFCGLGGESYAE